MIDVLAIGDNITDCYVDLDAMFPGGNAVNVAVHAVRSGATCAYLGSVGDDYRGRLLDDSLRAEGVDTTRLRVKEGVTAYALVRHVARERVFVTWQRGASLLEPTEEDLAAVTTAEIVHTTYCSGIERHLSALATRARLSFDFDKHLGDEYCAALIENVSIAEFSGAGLTDQECEDLLRWAHASGSSIAIATRGPEGSMLFDGREVLVHRPRPISPVDTLGAGDAFMGRALVGILAGEDPVTILAESTSAAEGACQTLGGYGYGVPLSKDPHLEEVLADLAREASSGQRAPTMLLGNGSL